MREKKTFFYKIETAENKDQVLDKGTVLNVLKKTNYCEELGLAGTIEPTVKEIIRIIEDNSNLKYIKKDDEEGFQGLLDDNTKEGILCKKIIETFQFVGCFFQMLMWSKNIEAEQKMIIEPAVCLAFQMGRNCSQLEFLKYEKDLVQKLKLEANKNKNNSEYWAKMLELEYQKQASRIPEKTKKSNCFYTIAEEYEKAHKGKKEAPHNKTLRGWWKKHFPERF